MFNAKSKNLDVINMKHQLTVITLFICLFLGEIKTVNAQWVFTNGPTTKPVTCLLGGILTAAGAHDGIYLASSNSWTSFNGILTNPGVVAIAYDIDRSNVFIGTDHGKIYVAKNGSDWINISPISAIVQIFSLASLSLGFNGIYTFAGTDGSFWRSTDIGTTWKELTPPVAQGIVTSIAVNGQNLLVVCQNTVSLSTDFGSSWTPANSGLPAHVLMLYAGIAPDVYAGTDNGVYQTTNNGTTWKPINNGMTGKTITSIVTDGTNLYAGTPSDGIFFSPNNGAAWQAANTGLPTLKINALAVTIQQQVIAATDANGVWSRSVLDFILNSVDDPNQNDINISVSPNPTTGIITVHNSAENIQHISVRNILGENIIDLTKPNASEFTLDLSKFPAGTYITTFVMPNSVITKKIIRE